MLGARGRGRLFRCGTHDCGGAMAWRFDAIDAMPSPSRCLLDGVESRNTLGSMSPQVFADESRWRLAATDDVALQIRPQTDAAETKRYYRSCGRLVAKALFDGQVRASVL